MQIDGQPAASLELTSPRQAGRQKLEGAVPPADAIGAFEVTLETNSHWSTIDDQITRSYRLIEAR